MNQYRTTAGIFNTKQGRQIYFDDNWMDSDTIVTPPNKPWDYSRELTIEDVDLWEIIWESSQAGVYAAWNPHAEFYLITTPYEKQTVDTYYGAGAQVQVQNKLKELNAYVPANPIWVDPEDMWLYQKPEPKASVLVLP